MKTRARHPGLWGCLLVCLGVVWLAREAGALVGALTVWGAQLGSWGAYLFMGLYSLAPTLHFRGAAWHMTGQSLCVAILGLVMLLMGTTIGSMIAYRLGCAIIGMWRTPRAPRVVEGVSVRPVASQVQRVE